MRMVSSCSGRRHGWPTLDPIPSPPYSPPCLRLTCGIIPADEIQAGKLWLHLREGNFYLCNRREMQLGGALHTLLCFLLPSWNTSAMSGGAAALWGPGGSHSLRWHHKSRGSRTLHSIVQHLPQPRTGCLYTFTLGDKWTTIVQEKNKQNF